MRLPLVLWLGLVPLLAAAPDDVAPGGPALAALSDPSEALATAFKLFCLDRYPDDAALRSAIAAEKAAPASAAAARAVLGPGGGQAWTMPTAAGQLTLAVQGGTEPGCAVSSDFAGSEANRAVFGLAVELFVGSHDLGVLQHAPVQQRHAPGGGDLTLEAMQVVEGATREQFLDGSMRFPDGHTQTRLVRVRLSAK